ncbi:hypothetical protein Godav_011223 [Gossypium davidsonii]|uniref:Pentatricopeptide repeat-containing protein n=1 Tax=Gossypium davidsonii TaxID=34287 RepID=A0A7J8RAI7_GOSDV|nr:hypothetical protein [Gossypium davidsonii]
MSMRDSVSYNSMIDGYIKRGMIDLARELFDVIPLEKMFDRDLISWNTIINGFVKCGNIEDAQILFDKMLRYLDRFPLEAKS